MLTFERASEIVNKLGRIDPYAATDLLEHFTEHFALFIDPEQPEKSSFFVFLNMCGVSVVVPQ